MSREQTKSVESFIKPLGIVHKDMKTLKKYFKAYINFKLAFAGYIIWQIKQLTGQKFKCGREVIKEARMKNAKAS